MNDELKNLENRINAASKKELELEKKLEKVTNDEQISSIKSQLEKIDGLIKHLNNQRNEILKQ